MSSWVQISGVLRARYFGYNRWPRILGPMAMFDDEDVKSWDDCVLPMGSEGSIEYFTYPYTYGDAVSFIGSLRDCDVSMIDIVGNWLEWTAAQVATFESVHGIFASLDMGIVEVSINPEHSVLFKWYQEPIYDPERIVVIGFKPGRFVRYAT